MPYRSQHAGRLADLLMQQGDIEAQRAQNSGDLWAGVARGLGGIPAGIQQRRAAEQAAIQKQQLFDSQMATAGLQRRKAEGEIEEQGRTRKQEDEARALATRTRKVSEWLGDVAGSPDSETRQAAYQTGRERLVAEGAITTEDAPEFFPGQSWVKSRMAQLLPAAERFKQMFPEQKEPKTREVKVRNPDGSESIQIVKDEPGQTFTSAAEPAKPDTRSLPLQANDALKRGDRAEYSRIMRVVRDEANASRAPQTASADPGPLETIIGPDGEPVRVLRKDAVGKPPASGTEKASSGVQKRVLNFFNRAQQADVDLEGMEPEIQEMGLAGQTWQAVAPNFLQTQIGQQYTAAQRAFTEARLRKDSGAAIPEQEFANDRRTYFVQPGDSKETLAQKRRAR